MIEYRIEQLTAIGPKATDSAWVWVASKLADDSDRVQADVERVRYDMACRSLRRHRVRRIEPGDPDYGKASLVRLGVEGGEQQ